MAEQTCAMQYDFTGSSHSPERQAHVRILRSPKAMGDLVKATTTTTRGDIDEEEKNLSKAGFDDTRAVKPEEVVVMDAVYAEPMGYLLSETLDMLPTELVLLLFSFLTVKDLCIASAVSKSWKELCDSPSIWRPICNTSYGCTVDSSTKHDLDASVHLWKNHCVGVTRCVIAHQNGKRVDPKQEEACLFKAHAIYETSLLTYVLLDLAFASLPQMCVWKKDVCGHAFSVATPSVPQPEPMDTSAPLDPALVKCAGSPQWERNRQEWVLLCKSALLDHKGSCAILQRALLILEKSYTDEAFMRSIERLDWVATVSDRAEPDTSFLADYIERLERNIKWSAVSPAWREERTPWRTDVQRLISKTATQEAPPPEPQPAWMHFGWWNSTPVVVQPLTPLAKMRKALLEMEQNISWDAMLQRWRGARHPWTVEVNAASTFNELLKLLLRLLKYLRKSSFGNEWHNNKRALWLAEVYNAMGKTVPEPIGEDETLPDTNTATTTTTTTTGAPTRSLRNSAEAEPDASIMDTDDVEGANTRTDTTSGRFAALLFEFESNLLSGCFLPSWMGAAANWRFNLHQELLQQDALTNNQTKSTDDLYDPFG